LRKPIAVCSKGDLRYTAAEPVTTAMTSAREGGTATRVLLVEDDVGLVRVIVRAMTELDLAVEPSRTLAAAEAALARDRYDAVILDLWLPDGNGLWLLDTIENEVPSAKVAVLSGFIDGDLAIDLYERVDIVIPKPVDARVLAGVVFRLTNRDASDSRLNAFCRHYRMSGRESELLGLAAAGVDNAEAAVRLSCKPATVTTYWRRIFRKTACRSQRDVLAAVLRFEAGR
jgi:DNA-binding NarL/FixJ family response regulator